MARKVFVLAAMLVAAVGADGHAENWLRSREFGRRGGLGGTSGGGVWELGLPVGIEVVAAKDDQTDSYGGTGLIRWGLRGAYGPTDWPVDITAEVARATDSLSSFSRWQGRLGVRKVWRADKVFQPTLGGGLELSRLRWEGRTAAGDRDGTDFGYGGWASAGFRWGGARWVFWTEVSYSYVTYRDFGSDVAPHVLYAGLGLGYRHEWGW